MIISTAPNGYFVNDLLIYGPLHEGGYASRGFYFEAPDLYNASIAQLNGFHDRTRRFLSTLGLRQRLQVQWYCDSNYKDELLRYAEESRSASHEWTRRVRQERFQRYWNSMENRQLRRERVILYVSVQISGKKPMGLLRNALDERNRAVLSALETEFSQIEQNLRNVFAVEGGRIRAMKAQDHYRHLLHFLNPSLQDRLDYDPLSQFNPERSIHENCWWSHGVGSAQSDFGFYMDDHFHNILTITRWPETTYPSIIHRLTSLGFLDYALTVNVEPLDVGREIRKEEHQFQRIEGDYVAEKKRSLLTAMKKKDTKIRGLAEGFTFPYRVSYIVRVWNKTKEGLSAITNAIKNAINSMQGCQYQDVALPSTCRKLFFDSWPGFPWRKNSGWFLYAEDSYLADMLPLSSTFTGHLETAEAIYEGGAHNLIGIKSFAVTADQASPQHAVLLGMSGCGKSAFMCDLLSQTEHFFDFTCIIEEGLSYGLYTQCMGGEPVIVQPDGSLTINYFDTQALPLTALQLSTATALVARMIGLSRDDDRQALRNAQIAQYVGQLYEDTYQDWSRKHPDQIPGIARHACAVEAYRIRRMPPGATPLEAFADLRDWRLTNPEEAEEFMNAFSEEEVVRFSKETATSRLVRNLAFAYFQPEDYPQHAQLRDVMLLGTFEEHDREQVHHMATMLGPWSADGNYGKLFDGVNNVRLNGRLCHFELGYIPEAAVDLRAAAAFLICNHTRQHIITLPRGLWKRNVYEEVGRILNIPGGDRIVSESYAQMRKFNAWNISIIQQYAMFKNSVIRPTIMGNSKQFFFMRQQDRSDLEDISRDIELPEITKAAIQKYPLPEQLTGQKYSAFTYYHTDVDHPICGTVHNVASREMLYCSSSNGATFDKRAKTMRKYANPLEGIVYESAQAVEQHA